jgi:hypothetical protein
MTKYPRTTLWGLGSLMVLITILGFGDYRYKVSEAIYRCCLRSFDHFGFFGMSYSAFGRVSEWTIWAVVFALPAWLVISPPVILRFRHLALRAAVALFITQVVICLLYFGLILPICILVIHHEVGDRIAIYEAIIFSLNSEVFLVCVTVSTLVCATIGAAIRAYFPKEASGLSGGKVG